MPMQNAIRLASVISTCAVLGLSPPAQDSDRMRETVKRLETALARVESHLKSMHGTEGDAAAQTTALDQVRREQEALRTELQARAQETAQLSARLAEQTAARQRLEDERATQARESEARFMEVTKAAAQREADLDDRFRKELDAVRRTAEKRAADSVDQARAAATERERETAALRAQIDAMHHDLAQSRDAAVAAQRDLEARLQAAMAELAAARSAAASAPPATVEGTTVQTSAGTVQVHHHGPGDIILNFHGAPPTPPAPARPRIEI